MAVLSGTLPGGGGAADTPAERRYSCAATSQALAEPVLGTASTTRGWLLVEEPGPWGPGAVPSSRLGAAVTRELASAAAAASSRLLLVRRPGAGSHRSPGDRRLFRVTCTRGQEQVLTLTCAPDEVADAATAEGGWSPHDGPLLLVCTHGRKDWCCALRGRPLARAIALHEPEGTWESSHLGGCRFAASVLALPTGHAYGRVDAEDAGRLVAAVRAGRVSPGLLRGRCTDAMVVQAADVHARTALDVDAVDGLVPVGARRLDDAGDAWRISLSRADAPGGRVVVELRRGHAASPQRLTCGAQAEQYARTWDLVGLVVEPPEPPSTGHE